MVGVAEISTAYNSLKAAYEIAKGINAIRSEAERAEASIDLLRSIIEAQTAVLDAKEREGSLKETIASLELKIKRFEAWDGETQRYELRDLDRGAYAYVQRVGLPNAGPPHWLCASCYGKKEKSILQAQVRKHGDRETIHACPSCRTQIRVGYMVTPAKISEQDAAPSLPSGEHCDKCGQDHLILVREGADPNFGDLGMRRRYYKCAACGFETEREVRP